MTRKGEGGVATRRAAHDQEEGHATRRGAHDWEERGRATGRVVHERQTQARLWSWAPGTDQEGGHAGETRPGRGALAGRGTHPLPPALHPRFHTKERRHVHPASPSHTSRGAEREGGGVCPSWPVPPSLVAFAFTIDLEKKSSIAQCM